MARMKFLCDADRCIECNACVTACKNEHEVPWGINRRRVVTLNDGKPGERSISMACMHCTDAPCAAVCPVNCFYTTADAVVLHSKDLCIGCGYCFYACPFGAPQYPKVGNFGSRGKMDKCTYCAGGPEADGSKAEYEKYGANRLAEGKLPLCAEMCSTKSLLAGDGDVIAQIYKERVSRARLRLRRLGLADGLSRNDRDVTQREEQQWQNAAFTHDPHRSPARWRLRFGRGGGAGSAQQPNSVNPTASAVKEQQLLNQLNTIKGLGTIPDTKSYVLEHPAGRDWREFRNGHAAMDRRHRHPRHDRRARDLLSVARPDEDPVRLVRARPSCASMCFERFVHWLTATSLHRARHHRSQHHLRAQAAAAADGPETFSTWSEWAKYSHNYLSFAFTIGVVLMFLMWVGEQSSRPRPTSNG